MREVTRHFAGLLIGPVLIIAGLVVDSSWHATDHAAHLIGEGYLLWFLGLLMLLFASVRMFLAQIAFVRGASTGSRQRLKLMRTATLCLYIGIAGAGLLLAGGVLDTSWHHGHREELDVFSPLHPYHSLVLVGLVANVAAGVRLFTAQVELSLRVGEAQSLSPLGTSVTPTPSGPLTILFTDMESSTGLTQRLGDEQAQQLVRVHNNIVRAALVSHTGSEIKHTGDGIMASFQSASRALECAIAIQRGVAANADDSLRVRIGLNTGEPVAEEQDLFGTAVQLASRVCDHAGAGEILASNVVRELTAGKGFLFADRGETALRGFEDPVRLYEVRWPE